MSFSRFIRSHDWWDYKLPPILAVGYATLLLGNKSIFDYYGYIALILLSVIIGAVYVSVINDISDIEVDLKAGKANKMASLPQAVRWLIPLTCIAAGIGFIYFFYYPDTVSCIFICCHGSHSVCTASLLFASKTAAYGVYWPMQAARISL
ncbi:hypothetical protein LWM68_26365 [Niabella sp. W65]|nr:hypothetical protein [Niabella sp. W65]MCH7365983.1 hypothetical protein [Niabella sp. W65]